MFVVFLLVFFFFGVCGNSPRVSVIMPVYNSEKYLKDSVESVLNSTMSEIELICVNDGSKDRSLAILRKYARRDSRVILVNQKNQGAAASRQKGIKLARGECIAFVDSDDLIDPVAYSLSYSYMKNYDADIVCFGWRNFSDDGLGTVRNDCPFSKLKIYDDWWEAKKHRGSIYLWNKLYRRDLIVDSGVEFSSNLKIAEDEGFNLCVFSQARRIVNIPHTLYSYRVNASSLMSLASASELIRNYFKMWEYVDDYYSKHDVKIGFMRRLWYFFSVYRSEFLPVIRNLLGI